MGRSQNFIFIVREYQAVSVSRIVLPTLHKIVWIDLNEELPREEISIVLLENSPNVHGWQLGWDSSSARQFSSLVYLVLAEILGKKSLCAICKCGN